MRMQATGPAKTANNRERERWSLRGARRQGLSRRSFVRMALGGMGMAAAGSAALLSGCSQPSAESGDDADGSAGEKKLNVAASFYPMYDFSQKIGGDHVDVSCLVPAGTEPHDWEPSPTDIVNIEESDLLVYNGASMEHWIDDVKDAAGSGLACCEASEGVELRAGEPEEGDEDAGDGPVYDPHVWLAPENAKIEMGNIRDALSKVDSEHASDYDARYTEYAAKLDDLDSEFREKLSTVPNKTIVVSHEAFGYLCDAYGLTQVAITGMDAEGEPDAQTMASIIDQVKATGIKTIFGEELVSQKVAQQIADATGAECKVLNPIEGLEQSEIDAGEDYFSVMRSNLDELVEALS